MSSKFPAHLFKGDIGSEFHMFGWSEVGTAHTPGFKGHWWEGLTTLADQRSRSSFRGYVSENR
jgi:hypothetical protein